MIIVWFAHGCLDRETQSVSYPRPNVLLVSIDSLRTDHVGTYGYDRDTTPTIDQLAQDGILFETAVSSSSWTVPAHMTMLTGLPPEVHGVTKLTRTLGSDATTLAEVLQASGYDTAAFVSGLTVMARYGFAQGFARYDESMVELDESRSHVGSTSPGLVDLVNTYLERWSHAGRQAPFFVFLHMWDVHYDYDPPAPYDRMFDRHYAGDLTSANFENNRRIRLGMDPRDLEHLIALYDGEIRFTDDHLGKVISRLRDLGSLDDTIVVVTSDHGEAFYEHGFKGHAKTLFDEVIRVPLVIRYPRSVLAGQRIGEQVRLMDLAPTILGLTGVPAPPGFAGGTDFRSRAMDLSPWMVGPSPRRPFPKLPAFSHLSRAKPHQVAIRTRAAKLIRYQRTKRVGSKTALFDLERDAGELQNLWGTDPAEPLRQQLEPSLELWQVQTASQPTFAEARMMDQQHREKLRALGYIH